LISKDQYFAAAEAEELASDLEGKIDRWETHGKHVGLYNKLNLSYQTYYGNHFKGVSADGSAIPSTGQRGELKLVAVNHYRNLLRHILIMTTSQRPSWDAKAVNSDPGSLGQAKLGNAILETYIREKRLGKYLKKAAEAALGLGTGCLKVTWDPSAGRAYGRMTVKDDNGEPVLDADGKPETKVQHEGDIATSFHGPEDVYYDPSIEDWEQLTSVTVRCFKNKHDLAARYPALRDKILAFPNRHELKRRIGFNFQSIEESDMVEVFEFYHKKTDALPNGRYTLFGRGGVVLFDGAYPYKKRLPVFRIVPGEIIGTVEGYTEGFDLLAIQEAINTLTSTIFTNQSAHGVQSVLVPNGANLTAQQIGNGMVALKYDPKAGKPEPMQLTATPKEIFEFLTMLERFAETISGVNSVARGNPESSLKSGVALGLVQSMALQYASGFQESWVELLEEVGTFILCDLLQEFAATERVVAMAGKNNQSYIRSFKGSDLVQIDRVTVEVGNPLNRTTGGRVQTAENLLQHGLIKTPQEYLTVLNTGQIEPLYKATENELALIHQENDDLLEGKPARALVGDAHLLHMQEHRSVYSDPELRRRSVMGDQKAKQIIQQALAHVQEHAALYQGQDPIFAMIAGEPPAPMPPMPPGPPMGPPPVGPVEPPVDPGSDFPPPPGPAPQPTPGALPGAPGTPPVI
jgi:hypothetical protein